MKEGFTVICNKCNQKQQFTKEIVGDGTYTKGEKIQIEVDQSLFSGDPASFGILCTTCEEEV